jgi:hypothetical protein
MSIQDPAYDKGYLNTVRQNNNNYGESYLKSIKKEMDPLIKLSKEIPQKIQLVNIPYINSLESFDNKQNNSNKFMKLIIAIIIITIIITILYNICKIK